MFTGSRHCSACLRYGVLWIYGGEDHGIKMSDERSNSLRLDGGGTSNSGFVPAADPARRGLRPHGDGRKVRYMRF